MITLTDEARAHLADILSSHGRPDAAPRVYVMPGGCSGLSYGMSLGEAGQLLGVTKQAVGQIEAAALDKLRPAAAERRLGAFIA